MTTETMTYPAFFPKQLPPWLAAGLKIDNTLGQKHAKNDIGKAMKALGLNSARASCFIQCATYGTIAWTEHTHQPWVLIFDGGLTICQLRGAEELARALGSPTPFVQTTAVLGMDGFPGQLAILFNPPARR